MEKTAFSKYFKKSTGVTYMQFLRTLRIEKAMEIILTSDVAVTEVSEEVGFGSLYTFERTLKAIVGFTPREYRRRQTEFSA